MCSWTVTSVIEEYNRKGSSVFGCAMDLSKAFDIVKLVKLFNILQEQKISPVFLQTMLYIYINPTCTVRLNGLHSNAFRESNGVRQGAVSSPLLFSMNIDGVSLLGLVIHDRRVQKLMLFFSHCNSLFIYFMYLLFWGLTSHLSVLREQSTAKPLKQNCEFYADW